MFDGRSTKIDMNEDNGSSWKFKHLLISCWDLCIMNALWELLELHITWCRL